MFTINQIKMGCKASEISLSRVMNPLGILPIPSLHEFVRTAAERLCDDYFICVGPATRYLIGMLDASDSLHTGEVVCIARNIEPVKLCELFDEDVDDIRVFTDEQLWEEARFEFSDYLRKGEARSFDNMVRYIVLEYALWLRNDYGIPEDDQMFWNNLESNLLDTF